MEGAWVSPTRPCLVAAACLAVVGAAMAGGCGADDSGRTKADSSAVAVQNEVVTDPPVTGGRQAEFAEVLNDVQDGMAAGKPGRVCYELSGRAKARLTGGRAAGACDPAVARVIRRQRAAGLASGKWRIVAVRVGSRAAIVTVTRPGDGTARVRVLHEGPSWELARFNAADSSGLYAVK